MPEVIAPFASFSARYCQCVTKIIISDDDTIGKLASPSLTGSNSKQASSLA